MQRANSDVHPFNRVPPAIGRVEWLQLWAGDDCETEWFDIAADGVVSAPLPGVRFEALPGFLRAESSSEPVRIRAVLRVEHPGCRLQIRGQLAPGSQILLRDAFACDMLQAVEGTPSLTLDLPPGRFSVDAHLIPQSSVTVELVRAAARRSRQNRSRSVG
jgi:hypothetical protein